MYKVEFTFDELEQSIFKALEASRDMKFLSRLMRRIVEKDCTSTLVLNRARALAKELRERVDQKITHLSNAQKISFYRKLRVKFPVFPLAIRFL